MKIFDPSGYVHIRDILSAGYPFNFIVGGRGTGKTFTALKTAVEDEQLFMLMRRTQIQADLISKPEFSVFKPLNKILGWDIQPKSISKYNSMFYRTVSDQQIPVGYSCALSTLSSMRGFDASDIRILIYDEFIPEPHEHLLKHEADALWNAYETMNRNRELSGEAALQLLCLANSNDIANPVFESLGLIRIADRMQQTGSMRWTDDKRGIQLIVITKSPISTAKSTTALYALTEGTDFAAMALSSDFRVDRSHIRPRPLSEYIPVVTIGFLAIYRHKSQTRLYCTLHKSGTFPRNLSSSETDTLQYRRLYRTHWIMYLSGSIDFEDVVSETTFRSIWNS